jgi:hypothetical protein
VEHCTFQRSVSLFWRRKLSQEKAWAGDVVTPNKVSLRSIKSSYTAKTAVSSNTCPHIKVGHAHAKEQAEEVKKVQQ